MTKQKRHKPEEIILLLRECDASDTEAINALQLQSAEKCVYFNDPKSKAEVNTLLKNHTHLRQPTEASYSEYKTGNPTETILHTKHVQHRLPFHWHFCKLQRRPRYGNNKYRDENWSKLLTRALFRRHIV